MKLLETSVYLGPNVYALFPIIRLTVDLGELEAWPTARLGRRYTDALVEALPGLAEHGCSYETPGGFIRRMNEGEGTWLGHVLEHSAIEIQNVAGAKVTFGKTRGAGEAGHYHVVYQYEEAEVGLEAGRLALALLHSLLPANLCPASHPADFAFEHERDGFIRFAQRRALGPSTASLVRAAEARDIPWLRLNHHSLIQFGHGRWQRRIQATSGSPSRGRSSSTARTSPLPRRRVSAARSSSSRTTRTTGAASRSTCATRHTCATRSSRRVSTAARSWSRASSRASTTGCSS
jgi:cyanophycin synthetase